MAAAKDLEIKAALPPTLRELVVRDSFDHFQVAGALADFQRPDFGLREHADELLEDRVCEELHLLEVDLVLVERKVYPVQSVELKQLPRVVEDGQNILGRTVAARPHSFEGWLVSEIHD